MLLLTKSGLEKLQKLRSQLKSLLEKYVRAAKCAETQKSVQGFLDLIDEVLKSQGADFSQIKKTFTDPALEDKLNAVYKLKVDDEMARDALAIIDEAAREFSVKEDVSSKAVTALNGVIKLIKGKPINVAAVKADFHVAVAKKRMSHWKSSSPDDWYNATLMKLMNGFSEIYMEMGAVVKTADVKEAAVKQAYQQIQIAYTVWANQAIALARQMPYRMFYIDERAPQPVMSVANLRKKLLKELTELEFKINDTLIKNGLPPFSLIACYLAEVCRQQKSQDFTGELQTHLKQQVKFLKEYAGQIISGDGDKKLIAKKAHAEFSRLVTAETESKSFGNEASLHKLFNYQYNLYQDHRNLLKDKDIGPGEMGAVLDQAFLQGFQAVMRVDGDVSAIRDLLEKFNVQWKAAPVNGISKDAESLCRAIHSSAVAMNSVLKEMGLEESARRHVIQFVG